MEKKIKLLFIVLTFLILNIVGVYAEDNLVLTLEEAKQQALLHTNDIKLIQAKIDLLDAQENYLYNAYDIAQNSTYYTIISTPPRNYDQALDLIKTSKKNWRDAGDRLDDAKVELSNKKEEVEYTVEKLYIDILALEKQINQLEAEYNLQMRNLEIARLRNNLGMITSVDVSSLAVQTSNINKLINSQKDLLIKQKWVLNEMIGKDLNSKLQLIDFVVEGPVPVGNAEEIIEKVLANSSVLRQQQRDINKMSEDLTDLDDSNKKKEQLASIEQAKIGNEELRKNIRNAVKLLVSDYEAKAKDLQLERIAFETAEMNYNWEEKKYELGLISDLQFESATIAYQKALENYRNSGYNYFLVSHLVDLAQKGILIN